MVRPRQLFDDLGNLVASQNITVFMDGQPTVIEETRPGWWQAKLPARTAVSRGTIEVRVTPRSVGCVRGRLIRGTAGWYVVDARGVGCSGRFTVVEPGQDVVTRGELGTGGFVRNANSLLARFATGSRLEVEGAVPRRVAIYAGSTPSRGVEVAEPFVLKREVFWRIPAAPVLSLRILEQSANEVRLRVESNAIDDLQTRLSLRASHGEIRPIEGAGTVLSTRSIEAVWRGDKLPVDVIATDGITGVSAWLQIK